MPVVKVPLVASVTVAVVGRGGIAVNVTVADPVLVTLAAVADAVTVPEPVEALVRGIVTVPLAFVVAADAVPRVPPVVVNVTVAPESAAPR